MQMYMRVSTAWWFKPYFYTLLFFVYLMQCEPDYEKFQRILRRALRVKGPFKNDQS